MPHTTPAAIPAAAAGPLAMLAAADNLVRQRAARPGAVPVPQVTVYLDEATAVFAAPARDVHGLVADLIRSARHRGIYDPGQPWRPRRQYATPAQLTAAIERGEA
ncbi:MULTISPECIES: hypothetical protein [Streptomyces]|uniref:Uncharacterized protein n=3 Tax=Streptomyces rimosus TaxID=1927 RepID=L8EZZ1_STRR1|nr:MULTISPECIES: hypothetical protein [Streptomyces]KOG73109.1 hypothetical protein ADK78_17805 [Kitasatospora aureofaciens]MYT42030.1 hypothetical protein [Streptomyces sp. SID5471]KEF04882.1 hypothetical protein DF17_21825 [Streptomyces rimosus]KEF16693.1 hypothetical protein DF18_33785 [Streptomyces rimosus]KOT38656.1 hypothetical protein ADK42_17085 [Streptomyces rimosus subsp. rimosus]